MKTSWRKRELENDMRAIYFLHVAISAILVSLSGFPAAAAPEPDQRFPLFAYLTGQPAPALVTYAPSQLDPRQEANQRRLPTSSIRADLEALRPAFDGLILYGYHEACTPREKTASGRSLTSPGGTCRSCLCEPCRSRRPR